MMPNMSNQISESQKKALYPVCSADIETGWEISFDEYSNEDSVKIVYTNHYVDIDCKPTIIVQTRHDNWWDVRVNTDVIGSIESLVGIDHAGITYSDRKNSSARCKHYDDAARIISTLTTELQNHYTE